MTMHTYRGFRAEPCFVSPTTSRPINSPKGWACRDMHPGYISSSGCFTWHPTLDDFRADVDRVYELAAEGRIAGRPEKLRSLRAAIERLPADEAAQARATLEAGLARYAEEERAEQARREQAAAEHEARRRLIEAAPELLAALQEIVDHFRRTGDPTLGDMAPRARAAIARATGEA